MSDVKLWILLTWFCISKPMLPKINGHNPNEVYTHDPQGQWMVKKKYIRIFFFLILKVKEIGKNSENQHQ